MPKFGRGQEVGSEGARGQGTDCQNGGEGLGKGDGRVAKGKRRVPGSQMGRGEAQLRQTAIRGGAAKDPTNNAILKSTTMDRNAPPRQWGAMWFFLFGRAYDGKQGAYLGTNPPRQWNRMGFFLFKSMRARARASVQFVQFQKRPHNGAPLFLDNSTAAPPRQWGVVCAL